MKKLILLTLFIFIGLSSYSQSCDTCSIQHVISTILPASQKGGQKIEADDVKGAFQRNDKKFNSILSNLNVLIQLRATLTELNNLEFQLRNDLTTKTIFLDSIAKVKLLIKNPLTYQAIQGQYVGTVTITTTVNLTITTNLSIPTNTHFSRCELYLNGVKLRKGFEYDVVSLNGTTAIITYYATSTDYISQNDIIYLEIK